MAIEMWDFVKNGNNEVTFEDCPYAVDLGDPNHDIERFIKGRNL